MSSRKEIANPQAKPRSVPTVNIDVKKNSVPDVGTNKIVLRTDDKQVLFSHTLVYYYTNLVIQFLGMCALITIAVGIIRIDGFIRTV